MDKPELDLTSVYAKLDRAEEHIQVLDLEIGAWLKSGHHTYTVERNDDLTQILFRAKMYGPKPDLIRWTSIAGDAINNLRSSLDNLIYALAKYESRNDPSADIDGLAFLIVDTPAKWDDKSNRRRVASLSLRVQNAIKSLQPFNRIHPILPPLLSILRDFSNADKHRMLDLAATAISGVDVSFTSQNVGPKMVRVYTKPIMDSDIFAIVESDCSEPNFTIQDAQFTMEIALWHRLKDGEGNTMQERTPVIILMNMLAAEVRFAVMEILAAVI